MRDCSLQARDSITVAREDMEPSVYLREHPCTRRRRETSRAGDHPHPCSPRLSGRYSLPVKRRRSFNSIDASFLTHCTRRETQHDRDASCVSFWMAIRKPWDDGSHQFLGPGNKGTPGMWLAYEVVAREQFTHTLQDPCRLHSRRADPQAVLPGRENPRQDADMCTIWSLRDASQECRHSQACQHIEQRSQKLTERRRANLVI